MTRNVAAKQFAIASAKKSSGEYPPPGPLKPGGIATASEPGTASAFVTQAEELGPLSLTSTRKFIGNLYIVRLVSFVLAARSKKLKSLCLRLISSR